MVKQTMISVEAAQTTILKAISVMPAETALLSETLARTLAEDVISGLDHPPWDTSSMDGYAICHADTQQASQTQPTKLEVIETIPAGSMPTQTVSPGTASKIMTGAPMPTGADAVVKVEETKLVDKTVSISVSSEVGHYIRKKGSAIQIGEPVLQAGIQIRAAEIAMMASIGKSVVPVIQKPRVGILSTGDELADLDEPLGENKIINSNGYGLAAQVREAGATPHNLGIAKDNKEHLTEKIKSGLTADFLLISGGVSMGDYDFVLEVLESLGVTLHLWQVAMKPGKPIAFGTYQGRPVFGLPGNPVSSMVTFEQFVRPALLKAIGRKNLYRPTVYATLKKDVYKRPGRQLFLRANLSIETGEYQVETTEKQDSSVLMSLVKSNALIVLPAEGDFVKAGERVLVQIFSEISGG